MHAGLNAQDGVLRRTFLDRRVQGRARLPVDRAVIARAVGQPLLQHRDLGTAHVSEIARLRRGRAGKPEPKHP
jgi:hypothetical protein